MAHGGDVALITHDTTWHDTADMYWLVVVSMSSCCAAKWWSYSRVHFVFSSTRLGATMSSMVLVLKYGSMNVFVSLATWCSLFVYPIASKYSSMCAPSSSHSSSHHDLSVHLFLQFTHDGITWNPKPPSLTWCIVFRVSSLGQMTD